MKRVRGRPLRELLPGRAARPGRQRTSGTLGQGRHLCGCGALCNHHRIGLDIVVSSSSVVQRLAIVYTISIDGKHNFIDDLLSGSARSGPAAILIEVVLRPLVFEFLPLMFRHRRWQYFGSIGLFAHHPFFRAGGSELRLHFHRIVLRGGAWMMPILAQVCELVWSALSRAWMKLCAC